MVKIVVERINQFEPYLGEEEKKELMEVIDSGWFTEAKKQESLKNSLLRLWVENMQY